MFSDDTWKVKLHPAFGDTGSPKPNFRLPESNVLYDARYEMKGWNEVDFPDYQWENATILGAYPCKPWNNLISRPFPNWRDGGLTKYLAVENKVDGDSLFVIGKLPKNITVTAYFKIKCKAGELIDIRSDNYKGGSEYNVRAEYVTKEGIQDFEMPNYVNGHHIIYRFPKDVKIISVKYRETAFNTHHIGSFRCNDEFYNKLWDKALNTMNLNMRDAIQDADRERSQWWGDAAIVLEEILYSCDNNGVLAIKKAINNLVDWQKSDGSLFSPVPAGSWNEELPLQMLASIGKYGFWYYYNYTGDMQTLKHVYPAVKKYLGLWKIGNNNLVEHRSGGWDWADWGNDIDVEILDNAWYCLALESAENMAHVLNDNAYADSCCSLRNKIVSASRKNFWTGSFYRSPKYKGLTDDRANGMAILAGFSSSQEYQKVRSFLNSRYAASPYMEKYILESYFVNNDIEGGLERMKKRYSNMVSSELTTLWEAWTIGGAGGGSINHGWAGGPLPLLSQYVAGISPLGAGWKEILVHPQLGNLKWIECTVPIGNKTIFIKVEKTMKNLSIRLSNNSGRICQVVIPADAKSVSLNGKKIAISNLNPLANDKENKKLLSLEIKEKQAHLVIENSN